MDRLAGLAGLGGLDWRAWVVAWVGGLQRCRQAGQNGGGLRRSSVCWAWSMCVHVVVGRRRLCVSCCSERRPPVMHMWMRMLAGAGVCRRWRWRGLLDRIGTYSVCSTMTMTTLRRPHTHHPTLLAGTKINSAHASPCLQGARRTTRHSFRRSIDGLRGTCAIGCLG
jgi:hypothetical protein